MYFFYQAQRQTPMITDQSTDDPYVSLPDILKSSTTITLHLIANYLRPIITPVTSHYENSSSRRCKHSAKRSFWGKLKKWSLAEKHHRNFSLSGFRFLHFESVLGTKISGDSRSVVRYHMYVLWKSDVILYFYWRHHFCKS